MKVLLVNGSVHQKGCTYAALAEVASVLNSEGVETEIFQIGARPIVDCLSCGGCVGKGRCVVDGDGVNALIDAAKTADGFVFGSPVYFAHPDGRIQCLLDRAFYAGRYAFELKPAAVVVSARRAGTVASLDVLLKYPTIASMPLVSSSYWNMVHGSTPEQVREDKEGLQTMRNLGRNMAWLLKAIEAGKREGIAPPKQEQGSRTNFIR